ncbi:MAG: histidine kinase [Oscillospiraceae bacterium]|nr:histidine kinase [Oscillospiraceae bacterium]
MKTTIRKKLLISIITLLTLLYVATGTATGIYVHSLLVEQAGANNRQVLIQAIQQIDIILQLGDMTARQIMTDTDIQEVFLEARQDSQLYKYVVLSRANETLTRYIALNPFVANIVVFTPDGFTLSNQGVLLSDHFRSREQQEWFAAFTESSERTVMSGEYETMVLGSTQNVVSLAYKYKILSQGWQDNYLMIDIPTYMFRNMLQIDNSYQGLLIVNDEGQTIIASELLFAEDLKGENHRNGVYFLKDTITLYERMDSAGWNLYHPIPKSEFNRPITQLLTGFVGLYIFVLLISIFLLSRRIRTIVEPVHRITSTMQDAYNGNLDVHTEEHTNDEFEILSDCFNKLVGDLKEHIQQMIDEENAKKEIQMDLLMSQIHPHFIYNTLNSVVYLIEEGDGNSAIDLIYALITILQNVVRIGSKEIFAAVSDELEMVKAYAEIASVRYPKMFSLEINCDPLLLNENIPKILIQPLVENAIHHGIIPAGKPGHIWVSIDSVVPQCIDICVEDDGVGITRDCLDAVWRGEKGNAAHGVGIVNIRNRIKFLYNNIEHHFEIEPRPGGGTRACIRLSMDGLSN